MPPATVNSMGLDYYRDFMGKHKATADVGGSESVKRVGTRIQHAVTRYFQQQGDLSRLEGYKWEFNLIEDPSINAFALPGGKVVVYTGILPITGMMPAWRLSWGMKLPTYSQIMAQRG